MRNYLITAPSVDVVSLSSVKTALGISGTSQDGILQAALNAAVGVLDPASGGNLGRALRPQTWELRLPGFYMCGPDAAIELPYPVVTAITSIKYDDVGGTEQTLVANTDYRAFGLGGFKRAYVSPAFGLTWPTARYDDESVRIRYVAGYATTPTDQMPAAITQAIILCVRLLLSNVERNLFVSQDSVEGVGEKRYVVSAAANEMITKAAESFVGNYRVR